MNTMPWSSFLTTILGLVYMNQPVASQTVDDTMRLIQNMTANYDSRVRPVINQTDGVQLNTSFTLISLQSFNDLTGVVTVVAMTQMNWTEERMQWDPADYGNLTFMNLPSTDVWMPKLVMVNAPDQRFLPGMNTQSVTVFSTGHLAMFSIDKLQTSCSVDVSNYPYDTQSCIISVIRWGYRAGQAYLHHNPLADAGGFQPVFVENSAWIFETSYTEVKVVDGISTLKLAFKCKRRPMYTVLNLIIPILTLAFINTWVFLLPPESGERTSFSITVLLSFVVYMSILNDNIPKGSEPLSLLTVFLCVTLFYSVSVLFCTVISLRIYNNDKHVPGTLQAIVSCMTFRYYVTDGGMERRNGNTTRAVGDAQSTDIPRKVNAWDADSIIIHEPRRIIWRIVGKVFDVYMFLVHMIWWSLMLIPITSLSINDE